MKAIILLVSVAAFAYVEGHGYLRDPLSRTSIHTMPNEPYRPPYYYDHSGVWCANIHQELAVSNCGRCGGPVGDPQFNQGGAYDKGVTMANYTAGSIIDVSARMEANHGGYYEIELCTQDQETDNCFTKLAIVGGNMPIRVDNRICTGYASQDVNASVRLPAGFRCNRCTLRWTYRTSYQGQADDCFNPGPAQTFRNCADIRIQ